MRAADQHGYMIMVLDAGGPDPFETSENRRVDGLIMVGPTLAAPDRPIVVIDTAAAPGRPSFVPDLSGGARAGLEHLLDLGHRQIGVVGDERTRICQPWRHGIDEALRAASVEPVWWGADDSIAGGRVATAELLTRHPGVTALACLSDRMALGAYLAAAELGRGVPERLSVLGFDEDSSLVTGLAPPLSTIRLPRRELGERATDELIRALASGGDGSRGDDNAERPPGGPWIDRDAAERRVSVERTRGLPNPGAQRLRRLDTLSWAP